ncbi:uncharacterized protein LOC110869142 [Helianthus annuus]|uniref:uncharacterized protein LOC110869142 n=1 Tax=Helianthus annuus TaxID=4232 RepID=UPI000B8F6DF6|nr:uncharacterized protein LOC110869142 [Helianthus annuus]
MTAVGSGVPSSIQINSRNPRVTVNANVATTRQRRLIRRRQSLRRKLSKFCLLSRFNTLVDMVKWLIIVAVMEQSLDFALCCLEKSVANCDSLSFIQVQRPFLLRW